MRVLVVDDEPPARERLSSLLHGLGHEVCGSAADGRQACREVERLQPDVVLLDIRMPGPDGLSVAQRLSQLPTPPAVIFVTAHDEHALEAFDARAVDYLLKPVRPEALRRALERARSLTRAQLGGLVAADTEPPLPVRLGNRLERIPLGDIYYFQAGQKYVSVRHRQGEAVTEESLKTLETRYGDRLLRIHRKALVVAAHLRGMLRTAEGQHLAVFDEIEDHLEISRRHLAAVRQHLQT